MFDITSKERLRDAYDFLSLLQNNPAPDSATPEQKAYRAMTIANTKREIRASTTTAWKRYGAGRQTALTCM